MMITSSLSIASNKIYIYATVNEKIITNFDIEKEVEYLKIFNPNLTNLSDKEIFDIGKESLINEIIKKSEIQKFLNFNEENLLVDDYLVNLYTNLNFKDEKSFANSLLKRNVYNVNEIKQKLKVEILWNELIYKKYSKQLKIDKELFSKKIEKLKNKEINDFLLSEIVFEKKKDETLDLTMNKIQSSISEIGFSNTANILSIADSSKMGGNIGWISEQNLSDNILKNLKKIGEGQQTEVIQIGNNFLILKIEKKKTRKISIDKEKELNKMISFETNKQLNQFSRIYFNKSKINYSINEK